VSSLEPLFPRIDAETAPENSAEAAPETSTE